MKLLLYIIKYTYNVFAVAVAVGKEGNDRAFFVTQDGN